MTGLAAAVAQVADDAQLANHATMRAPISATEVYDAVGSLDELAHRLPQLLEFLIRSLRSGSSRDYFDDRGTDPGPALVLAGGALDDARRDVLKLSAHLTDAHNHLGHLGRLNPED